MKQFLYLTLFLFLTIGILDAGVVKESKTAVTFKGFGKYSSQELAKIADLKKSEDKSSDFKGEGFLGKMTAKLILRPGKSAEITDLEAMKIFSLDHTKKEFTVRPIEKIEIGEESGEQETSEEQEEEGQSNIRIIRSEFKVKDTGEKKTINNFACKRYDIFWVTVWENIETKEQGTDSLFTMVWTTEAASALKKAQDEEMKFNLEYMKRLGVDMNDMQQEILGIHWLTMFQQLNPKDKRDAKVDYAAMAKEMQKIQGYPISTEGKYFALRPQDKQQAQQQEQPQQQEEESSGPPSMDKMFGGLMKKAVKKEEKPKVEKTGPEAAFEYATELIKYELTTVDANAFSIPSGYKEIKKEK